jgi:putative ABC transport system ATP-binding protein
MSVDQMTSDTSKDVAEARTTAVQVVGARKTFTADLAPVRALRGADLEVRRGEFVAVMGPSGCGKSTLLNAIAGLDQLDEGTIHVDGQEISGQNEDWLARFRRKHVGIVFQFFNLLDDVSALDNVALAGVVGGQKRKAALSRAADLLDLLGIGDKAGQSPAMLSGGQRQRLAIARALINDPTVLLADEPTGALDSAGGEEVLELFRRLHTDGQTIVMVTHSSEVAAGASRLVRMQDGQVVDAGSAAPSTAATSNDN